MLKLTYVNESLQIRLNDWETVYRFPKKALMEKEIQQGNLYYRSKGQTGELATGKIKNG